MTGINHLMARFILAAGNIASDYADTQVRGYLKAHPDLISAYLEEVENVTKTVRTAVEKERASGEWGGPLEGDPAGDARADLAEGVVEFEAHTCSCPFCMHGGPDLAAAVRDELDRVEQLPDVQNDAGARWVVHMVRQAMARESGDAPLTFTVKA